MERYDYRNNLEMAGEVSAEIDKLDTKQLVTVHQAIQTIRADTEADEKERYKNWFRAAILPVLKQFSELTSSCLEIEYREFIDVKLRNGFGLDVTESCRGMHMALLVASHISIGKEQDEVVLGLIYDPRKFIN